MAESAACRRGQHGRCNGFDGEAFGHPDSLALCSCTHHGRSIKAVAEKFRHGWARR